MGETKRGLDTWLQVAVYEMFGCDTEMESLPALAFDHEAEAR